MQLTGRRSSNDVDEIRFGTTRPPHHRLQCDGRTHPRLSRGMAPVSVTSMTGEDKGEDQADRSRPMGSVTSQPTRNRRALWWQCPLFASGPCSIPLVLVLGARMCDPCWQQGMRRPVPRALSCLSRPGKISDATAVVRRRLDGRPSSARLTLSMRIALGWTSRVQEGQHRTRPKNGPVRAHQMPHDPANR